MITRAYLMRGLGDSLNARDFLLNYCQQKKIKQEEITIYTALHKEVFEDTKFKIEVPEKVNMRDMIFYGCFGYFDLPKLYQHRRYDLCIAKNANLDYNFEKIKPLNWSADISNIELPQKFVTINYGHDNNSNPLKKCLKMWSLDYWVELVKNIGVDCVQIGAGWTCKNIDGVKLNLVDKLSLKQSAMVMKKALFHIDIEGGLPILNYHLGGKSVVLFGATDMKQLGKKGNLNLRNSNCQPCNSHLDTTRPNKPLYVWTDTCKSKCMSDLKPQYVIEQIKLNGWL